MVFRWRRLMVAAPPEYDLPSFWPSLDNKVNTLFLSHVVNSVNHYLTLIFFFLSVQFELIPPCARTWSWCMRRSLLSSSTTDGVRLTSEWYLRDCSGYLIYHILFLSQRLVLEKGSAAKNFFALVFLPVHFFPFGHPFGHPSILAQLFSTIF